MKYEYTLQWILLVYAHHVLWYLESLSSLIFKFGHLICHPVWNIRNCNMNYIFEQNGKVLKTIRESVTFNLLHFIHNLDIFYIIYITIFIKINQYIYSARTYIFKSCSFEISIPISRFSQKHIRPDNFL